MPEHTVNKVRIDAYLTARDTVIVLKYFSSDAMSTWSLSVGDMISNNHFVGCLNTSICD
jgi:hypothetical protein